MPIECPNCGSKATQSLYTGWQKGTRIGESSISYSAWALRCQPPQPRVVVGSLGWALLFILSISLPFVIKASPEIHVDQDMLSTPWFTFLAVSAAGIVLTIVVRFFRMVHHFVFLLPNEHERWTKSWICHDCSEKFIPESDTQRESG